MDDSRGAGEIVPGSIILMEDGLFSVCSLHGHDDIRGTFGEKCGLAGAVNIPRAARVATNMNWTQQQRGERGAGCVSTNRLEMFRHRDLGKVEHVFGPLYNWDQLPGSYAIGHNRYATKGGANERSNLQPLYIRDSQQGEIVLAHNGQLLRADELRMEAKRRGACFTTTTDSEVMLHAIAGSQERTLEEALLSELPNFPAAYSLLVMTKDQLVAIRDPHGVRPLSIASYEAKDQQYPGYLIASETDAFDITPGSRHVCEVEPGEMVIFYFDDIEKGKPPRTVRFANPDPFFCMFEKTYFSAPRSMINGCMHEDFRMACGEKVFYDNEQLFRSLSLDVIIPILDSGKQGGIGFSKASGIPYKEYFLRRHNAPKADGRSYTALEEERAAIAFAKLDLRTEKIAGKRVGTVDDSNVRGNTARTNNDRLRAAGATYICNVFLCPPITGTCHMGMDHQKLDELIAHRCHGDLEAIARDIHADKVVYLSLESYLSLNSTMYRDSACAGCFGGPEPQCSLTHCHR